MELIHPPKSPLHYRPDIDGLRAVAVLLVVFCHLGYQRFAGGYVGVDVFFVISGYLISGILLREIGNGTFSLAGFYERRVRRIAPALLVVLGTTALMARHFMFRSDFADFGRSLLAALLSASNFYFMQDWRYFDPGNQARPLLHTWSLAVEEQYYLVFPVVLFLLFRYLPRWRKPIVWLLALASLAAVYLQMAGSRGLYNVAFFFSPLRAWELLIGTLIYDLPRIQRAWQRHVLSVLGLAAILSPALRYTSKTPFPGLAAVQPCVGAALIIVAGITGPSLVGYVLSWRPIRFVGLISYSLYLVHWPLIVFQKDTEFLFNAELHPRRAMPFVLALSMVLATLCWRFIELPFREGPHRPSRRNLYAVAAPVFALLLLFAALTVRYEGGSVPPFHFTPTAISQRYDRFNIRPYLAHSGHCFVVDGSFSSFTTDTCLTIDANRPNWLLFGDSHADTLYEGLARTFPEANISQANMTSCWPMIHAAPASGPSCRELNAFVFTDYVLHHPVNLVLLYCRWDFWQLNDLGDTIAWLQQHHIPVVVVGPDIEFDAPLPRLILVAERQHSDLVYTHHASPASLQMDQLFTWLAANRWHVPYISMYKDFCDPAAAAQDPPWQRRTATACPIYATPATPLLYDTNHLTAAGSDLFAQTIRARHQLPAPGNNHLGDAGDGDNLVYFGK